MGTMKDIADNVRGSLIPQLYVLRRVVLTVAITDRQNTSVIESLRRFTGQAIFPVLIDPTRMRLLIQRIERYEQSRGVFCSRAGSDTRKVGYYQFSMLRIQVDSIVMLLSCQKKRRL